MNKIHCSNCGLNYQSERQCKYSNCPRCGLNGDRHGNTTPYNPKKDGPMTSVVEKK